MDMSRPIRYQPYCSFKLCSTLMLESFLIRAVTKISSCWLNTRSRLGIKQLLIYFGSTFLLFSCESSWDHV